MIKFDSESEDMEIRLESRKQIRESRLGGEDEDRTKRREAEAPSVRPTETFDPEEQTPEREQPGNV